MAVLKSFILVIVLACALGASFYNTGYCPDNRGVGERWFPFGSCLECYCDVKGYGCSGCDTVTPIQGCYTVVNKTLSYPECCPHLVCPPVIP